MSNTPTMGRPGNSRRPSSNGKPSPRTLDEAMAQHMGGGVESHSQAASSAPASSGRELAVHENGAAPARVQAQPLERDMPRAMGPIVEEVRYVDPWKVRLSTTSVRVTIDDKAWEAIHDMARSMVETGVGVIDPVLVRPIKWERDGDEEWEAIKSDIRLLAAREANVLLPIIERPMQDIQAMIISVISTFHDHAVNSIDKGKGLKRLIDALQLELDTLLEAGEYYRQEKGKKPNKILSAAAWEQVQRDFVTIPPWVHDVMARSMEKHRSPKIIMEDIGKLTGLGTRQLQYLLRDAELANQLDPDVIGSLSGAQNRLLHQVDDVTKRKTLAREMKKGLKGQGAMKRFRQLMGLPERAAANGSAAQGGTSLNESGGSTSVAYIAPADPQWHPHLDTLQDINSQLGRLKALSLEEEERDAPIEPFMITRIQYGLDLINENLKAIDACWDRRAKKAEAGRIIDEVMSIEDPEQAGA